MKPVQGLLEEHMKITIAGSKMVTVEVLRSGSESVYFLRYQMCQGVTKTDEEEGKRWRITTVFCLSNLENEAINWDTEIMGKLWKINCSVFERLGT